MYKGLFYHNLYTTKKDWRKFVYENCAHYIELEAFLLEKLFKLYKMV